MRHERVCEDIEVPVDATQHGSMRTPTMQGTVCIPGDPSLRQEGGSGGNSGAKESGFKALLK